MSVIGDEAALKPARLTLHIVTLFPTLFTSWLSQGVVARAVTRGVLSVQLIDLRSFGIGKHRITDDYPFGGGAGMVMKPEPIFAAVESIQCAAEVPVVLMTPHGATLTQRMAESLAQLQEFVVIAGHYEGVDERVRQHLVTEEVSIGDYVLSNGELAAMVMGDAVARLLPGAIAAGSIVEESFSGGLLEYPQYTRPSDFRGWRVPDVLVSGNHGLIAKWRRAEALRVTQESRPDLVNRAELSPAEARWLKDSAQDSAT